MMSRLWGALALRVSCADDTKGKSFSGGDYTLVIGAI
jgi:hypothetical protein